MKKNINGFLKNKNITTETMKFDITGDFDKDSKILTYQDDDELKTKNFLTIENNLIKLIRENDDVIITFYFEKSGDSIGVYYLKDVDQNIDMTIFTDELIIEKNKIYIKYYLTILEDDMGLFEYEVNFN